MDGAEVDGWLAGAAAEGDEGAFEQLVRRHTPALYAGALRATGSPEMAQDVVQEAWLSVWLSLHGFRGQSAVRTWLVRIATTKALNALRRPHRTVPLEAVPEPVTAGTEREAELRERAAAVRTAIAQLPVRQREAVALRDLQGLSYDEVAEALGCSVSSVKSALFRGRQGLAVALEQYRPGDVPGAHRQRGSHP
ncbi:sigma-70 family RNA polymerase sigma factor [soil metagenome]